MSFRSFLVAAIVIFGCGLAPAAPVKAVESTGPGNSCGRAGTEAGNVPNSLGIFHAHIVQIDGHSAGMERYQHKLAAGKHILVLAEDIKSTRLNSVQTMQIARVQSHSATPLKALVLDVRPGTSYRIGPG